MILRCLILSGLILAAAQLFALTPNWPAGTLRPDMLAQTRTGPVDCILAAPLPRIPAMRGHAHGLYAADIAVATGYVYATRVIEKLGQSRSRQRDAQHSATMAFSPPPDLQAGCAGRVSWPYGASWALMP